MAITGDRKGRSLPLAVAFAIAAIAAALVTSLGASGRTSAQTSAMIGFDVRPDSNQPAALGNLETCARAEVGETFAVDVFVNNVQELTKWELRVGYDADVLQLQDADYNFFLASTPPGGNVFPTLFDAESDGRYFLAAAEVQGAPDSGSGVLARLRMAAVAEGESELRIVRTPTILGPQLSGAAGATVGDSSGDGIWDGSYLEGTIVVGDDCEGDAPVVTPGPSPRPTATPAPGRSPGGPGATTSPAPGEDGGGEEGQGQAGENSGSDDDTNDGRVVLIGEDGELLVASEDAGSGANDDPPGNSGTESDNSEGSGDPDSEAGGSGNSDNDDTNGGGGGRDLNGSSVSGGDGGTSTTWIIGGLAAAMGLVVAGGALYGFARRRD